MPEMPEMRRRLYDVRCKLGSAMELVQQAQQETEALIAQLDLYPRHLGNFEPPPSTRLAGEYGSSFELPDGSVANVVTVMTGPGLAANTEIESNRPLTKEEQSMLLEAAASIDASGDPRITYDSKSVQHRF